MAIGNSLPGPDGAPLTEVEGMVAGRVGVYPWHAFLSERRRLFDIGVGYAFEAYFNEFYWSRNRHGAFLGLHFLPDYAPMGQGWFLRGQITATGEVFGYQAFEGIGGGGTLAGGVEMENFTYSDSISGEGPRFMGIVSGEYGIGLEAALSYRVMERAEWWTLMLGIKIRSPFLFGIGVLPLSGSF
jgi:hypothetical protein